MKKLKLLIIALSSIFLLTGCGTNSNLDNATIYTTVYPVEYIMKYLYGDNSTISSIYPDGIDINTYTLTEKQIATYASGDLFVYMGLGSELEIAKSFINENKNLLIIDATYGLSSDNDLAELWMSPNNFLMLAKNIKNSLIEYLDNSVKEDAINEKYDELYENVSWLSAELYNIGEYATENSNNTIVVATNSLKFLEKYGFNIISLEDISNSESENALSDIKSKFKNNTYSNILKLDTESNSDLVTELSDKYSASVIELKNMIFSPDSASTYITIQYENLATISDMLLK